MPERQVVVIDWELWRTEVKESQFAWAFDNTKPCYLKSEEPTGVRIYQGELWNSKYEFVPERYIISIT